MKDEIYYMQIDGIQGPVKVSGFTNCFQLNEFSGGDVENHFTRSHHGPGFVGTPKFQDIYVVVGSVDGQTASKLYKSTIDATPHTSISIHHVARIKGQEQKLQTITLTDAFVHGYEEVHNKEGMNLALVLGAPAKVEKSFFKYDESGTQSRYVVTHDFVTSKTT